MPKISIPEKLLPILTTKARIVVILGGRGSGKSETVGRLLLMKCQTEAADVLCGREFQLSIADSTHKLVKGLIPKIGVNGFNVTENKIECSTGGTFKFRGFSRSPESVKSASDFKYSWVEEAQAISQETLDNLLPTIRSSGSQLFFTANPQSSNDPFSNRFINPYIRELMTNGIYEDEMHLIVWCNYNDNPFFPDELELQRKWDYENLSRSKYLWIWEGEFNDSIEDALIQAEWFNAAVDAHLVLGFQPLGMKMAAHDPSDEGGDNKGYAMRHGSVVMRVEEKLTGNVNEGNDWALGMAIEDMVDGYTWDCDGMGVALNREVSAAFHGKHTKIAQFKGSEAVDFPDKIFEGINSETGAVIQGQKTNKQALRNKRAQYYHLLRKKILNTYNAVVHKKYCDPDMMISFNSATIPKGTLQKLRSEVCRMPIKPNGNGLFELYTKAEMKGPRFKIDSPGLADSVMMLQRQPYTANTDQAVRPQPIKTMGRR